MSTATKTKESSTTIIGGVPTKELPTGGITSAPRTNVSAFTRMALESTDFACKLHTVEPVAFFASSTDDRGRVVLDLFVDLGFASINGIRVRQQQGQIRMADGSQIDNFSVSVRGVPINPQFGGNAHLHIHREETSLPNGDILCGGDFRVGSVSAHEIGLAVWTAYCTGRYSGIDHERAGVKRLSPEELQTKIERAMAAREERIAKREQAKVCAQSAPVSDPEAAISVS